MFQELSQRMFLESRLEKLVDILATVRFKEALIKKRKKSLGAWHKHHIKTKKNYIRKCKQHKSHSQNK